MLITFFQTLTILTGISMTKATLMTSTTKMRALNLNVLVGRSSPHPQQTSVTTPFSSIRHSPIKLPVWPVSAGVIAQVFDWIPGGKRVSESIISTIGGRVVPVTLSDLEVSPFLLLAHHAHSFTPLDPVRAATRFFLPEGFPAHPHSGFDTLTYCIDGGLRHRDSEGIKMSYGDGEAQWMRAGRGVIHEEMWDLSGSDWKHKRIEIYQIWINLPRKSKLDQPLVHVLRNDDIPVVDCGQGCTLRLLCGSVSVSSSSEPSSDDRVFNGPGNEVSRSPVNIAHLTMSNPDSSVTFSTDADCTVTVYVRQGSLMLGGAEIRAGDLAIFRGPANKEKSATSRRTLYEEQLQQQEDYEHDDGGAADAGMGHGTVTLTCGSDGLDGLVLTGKPLNERVLMGGPLVQATEEDYRRSATLFNEIGRNAYWDYKIDDEEWMDHVNNVRLQERISKVVGVGRDAVSGQ